MQETRGWDSTAFGTMQGSEVFLNVFVFFLIFAVIILDKMGVRFTAVLSAGVMLVGACIKWFAVSESFMGSGLETWFTNNLNYIPLFDELGVSPFYRGMPASAKFAACGFMIFGCGCEMAGITVSRGIVKWFKGREMALAMGSEMALARLGVATCMIFSPFFAKLGGQVDVSRSVAFGVVLMCIALIMCIVYFFMDKKLDAQTGEAEEKDDPFKVSDIGKILSDGGFWIVALLCVLYYSAIFPFQRYAPNFLEETLQIDAATASRLFSVFPILAMVLTPALGIFLDHKGKGATMLMAGSVIMIVCHLSFAFLLPLAPYKWLAVPLIVVLGVSFSLVPAALWPSVPKIIDEKILGSAYCLIFWVQNIGLCLVPMLIGSLRGSTGGYFVPMLVFSSFGVLAFIFSFLLKKEDRRKGYGLELPNIRK
jgi:nitrate/nitrite transporter NarK